MTQTTKTIGELNFRNFENKKIDLLPAATLTFEEFCDTKEVGQASRVTPYGGVQTARAIQNLIHEVIPDSQRSWGNVHVYRDSFSHPGYVTKLSAFDAPGTQLLAKETPITDLCFNRAIGTIDLIGNKDYTSRIAFKYESGSMIQVAFGLNVRICENFNIFGGSMIQTNLRNGMDFAALMENVRKHLADIETKFNMDLAEISRLQSIPLGVEKAHERIGELQTRYWKEQPIMQLTDISSLSRNIAQRELKSETDNVATLWDFANRGTEVIRFDDNSGASTLENLKAWSDYICSFN